MSQKHTATYFPLFAFDFRNGTGTGNRPTLEGARLSTSIASVRLKPDTTVR